MTLGMQQRQHLMRVAEERKLSKVLVSFISLIVLHSTLDTNIWGYHLRQSAS